MVRVIHLQHFRYLIQIVHMLYPTRGWDPQILIGWIELDRERKLVLLLPKIKVPNYILQLVINNGLVVEWGAFAFQDNRGWISINVNLPLSLVNGIGTVIATNTIYAGDIGSGVLSYLYKTHITFRGFNQSSDTSYFIVVAN